jgi:hypothetical protein
MGGGRQVFLKQFRDVVDQTDACYQCVVEAEARIRSARPRRPGREWKVTIHSLDSHPICKELGIESQGTRWSVHLSDFQFDVLGGEIVAPPSHATTAARSKS